jgi:phospholipid/cholesterol/gamma-HCH transport system substrate-binding protein
MRNTLETRLGIFVAVAVVAVFIILETLGTVTFKPHRHVNADFKNVQELRVGDPVKMAGVQVGKVAGISITNQPSGSAVRVTMSLEKNAPVRTDSKATVKFTGLMGQNYVALDFGSPGGVDVADNAVLPTAEQPDLSQIMAKLDNVATGVENLTKSFTGDKIDNLLGPFTDFLKQNSPALTAMIGNMKVVSERVVQGQGTVGKLINDDSLYLSVLNTVSNLQDTASDVKLLLSDARLAVGQATNVIAGINSGRGTIGKLVKDETLYNETTAAMTNLNQILYKINSGQGSVGALINDQGLLKNVKLSLQKLDKATESLEDTGPLSVLGTAVNSLF